MLLHSFSESTLQKPLHRNTVPGRSKGPLHAAIVLPQWKLLPHLPIVDYSLSSSGISGDEMF